MAAIQSRNPIIVRQLACSSAVALAVMSMSGVAQAQQVEATTTTASTDTTLDAIRVSSDWLGSGLQNSVKTYAGARTVVKKEQIENSGASSITDVMRRIPGVQVTENAATAGTPVSLNIGVRGLTGRYSPRSTVLLDGVPMSFAPYGQPQLSFAPISLANIETIDVVRGGGAVRYGPQNVGGIINFRTRAIPTTPGMTGDATVRQIDYGEGGSNTQYSTFVGGQLDNGLGIALLYSGSSGSGWRENSDQSVNDFALKLRYELTPTSEIYGKLSYYDVKSNTPGALTPTQYAANPYQNTRPRDYWSGDRKGIDIGYINNISDTQEFEIRSFFNESFRQSTLATTIGSNPTSVTHSPREYRVFGIEPRYTQRFALASTTHDVTVGYRYLSERGNDPGTNGYIENLATGTITGFNRFNNATDAHAVYIDDKITIGSWRITPGVRYERIDSQRENALTGESFDRKNNKALPQLNIAYLLTQELTVFSNYGKSFGPVQNTQLNQNSAGNPLEPETATTTELGARWQSRNLSAEATIFNIDFDNQIDSEGTGVDLTYRNLGKTKHQGIETAIDYAFDDASILKGWNVYANYTYTHASLENDDATDGNDLPFYSRNTDTIGARYQTGPWTLNLSSTHQSRQYADEKNTVVESANGNNGVIPGYRVLNAQVGWKVPNQKGFDILAGINNLTDKQYYTRITGGSGGRLVGAPRTIYIQGRYAF
ncbi:MAG TPA: TonB-dependent siderophore receptor [Oxalicibacterium sp.]|uniref:TonB-dependent receptor family protein n=1 Tax=Oxalicibacterium sp. TaxID=2766525 RepID=UPI002CC6440F|nr:TonB-dependent siderophore receptor [Oxalicibacterium sp.]HWU99346.1 TonB-dependent siderophore receptor [Oxalicibacterium sp.]